MKQARQNMNSAIRRISRYVVAAAAVLGLSGAPVKAQGTLNIALQQQFSFVGCSTGGGVGGVACGAPMIGCQLFIFQVGTVSTQQLAFQDTALTVPLPWPVQCDGNARLPMFYLLNGSVHIRLTDASGIVQYENQSVLVVGPSGGGGGGGGVDPSTVSSSGDVKWRPSTEILSGWVKLNATTIGSAASGATQRANADTQALFIWLWTNCSNPFCAVSSGRGATALADFNANKTIVLPDMRAIGPFGLDDMGAGSSGLFASVPVVSGTITTPSSLVGEQLHGITQAELPAIGLAFGGTPVTLTPTGSIGNDPHNHQYTGPQTNAFTAGTGTTNRSDVWAGTAPTFTLTNAAALTLNLNGIPYTPAGSVTAGGSTVLGSSVVGNRVSRHILGTWWMKL